MDGQTNTMIEDLNNEKRALQTELSNITMVIDNGMDDSVQDTIITVSSTKMEIDILNKEIDRVNGLLVETNNLFSGESMKATLKSSSERVAIEWQLYFMKQYIRHMKERVVAYEATIISCESKDITELGYIGPSDLAKMDEQRYAMEQYMKNLNKRIDFYETKAVQIEVSDISEDDIPCDDVAVLLENKQSIDKIVIQYRRYLEGSGDIEDLGDGTWGITSSDIYKYINELKELFGTIAPEHDSIVSTMERYENSGNSKMAELLGNQAYHLAQFGHHIDELCIFYEDIVNDNVDGTPEEISAYLSTEKTTIESIIHYACNISDYIVERIELLNSEEINSSIRIPRVTDPDETTMQTLNTMLVTLNNNRIMFGNHCKMVDRLVNTKEENIWNKHLSDLDKSIESLISVIELYKPITESV